MFGWVTQDSDSQKVGHLHTDLCLMEGQSMEEEAPTKIPTMVEKAFNSFWRTQEFKVGC